MWVKLSSETDIHIRNLAKIVQDFDITWLIKYHQSMVWQSDMMMTIFVKAIQSPQLTQSIVSTSEMSSNKPQSTCWNCWNWHFVSHCPFKQHCYQRCNKTRHKGKFCWPACTRTTYKNHKKSSLLNSLVALFVPGLQSICEYIILKSSAQLINIAGYSCTPGCVLESNQ